VHPSNVSLGIRLPSEKSSRVRDKVENHSK
jgi:hypothetical protein